MILVGPHFMNNVFDMCIKLPVQAKLIVKIPKILMMIVIVSYASHVRFCTLMNDIRQQQTVA